MIKILLCLVLTFVSVFPKSLIIYGADSYSSTTNITASMFTYNGTTYNSDRTKWNLVFNEWHSVSTSKLFDTIVFEMTPYEFVTGQYLKLDFSLELGCVDKSLLAIESAEFVVYNTDDYTSSKPYELIVTESSKNQYYYSYYGEIEGLERPGNCIRIKIHIQKSVELGKLECNFHSFNLRFDEDGETHGLLGNIISFLGNLPSMIADSLANLFQSVVNAVSSIGSAITSALTSLGNLLTTALDTLGNAINSTLNYISSLIIDSIVQLGETILDGIYDLVVPSSSTLTTWFEEVNEILSKQFGFLYFPIDFIIEFLSYFSDVVSEDAILKWNDIYLTIPNLKGSFLLIKSGQINFTSDRAKLSNMIGSIQSGYTFNTIWYYFTDAVIYFSLINLGYRKLKSILSKG